MAWNDPDSKKNPWSGKNQPPDLDEALKRLQRKIKKFLRGNQTVSSSKKSNDAKEKDLGAGFLTSILGLIVVAIWALSGIFIVDPAEKAAVLRFGKYVETVGPGPHWIPRLIESKVIMNVDRIADYSYSAQMLTKDENLVSVAVAVQYRINDLRDYLFNVTDPEESLQQATSSALRQVVGSTTLDQIITEGREAWGQSVQEALTQILSTYKVGINIVNVSPQPARAPESVQDAFDDAIKAQEDEKRFKEQARAYEARVVPIAMGNARRIIEEAKAFSEQVVLQAKGETAEFLALLPEYNRSPAITGDRIYFDAMQNVLSRSSKIIVDAKAGNIMYLPLDKLALNKTPKNMENRSKNLQDIQEDSAGNPNFDGRNLIRPTEPVGGVTR